MQPVMLVGEVLSVVAARFDSGGDRWIITLCSLIALVAVGGVAARLSRRLMRSSSPELIVLLNQSAEFYRCWPEHRRANVPSAELVAEANRCQRIIELLEQRLSAAAADSPAARGPIDGLHEWIRLLQSQIHFRDGAPTATTYA
jgi:hypothetical protein